jgi:N-acetylglucosaminyl-diphospho-decaprenol L-rhamnosyltransferase
MNCPSLDVIIVNWNTGPLLAECLQSVASVEAPDLRIERVVVVDNCSSDRSAEDLDTAGLPVRLVRNPENLGFARACNQGASGSRADYLLFLNPDTRLLPDSLSRPVAFMESRQAASVGICGVRNVGDEGQVMPSTARFPTLRIFIGKMTGLSEVLPAVFPTQFLRPEETETSRFVDHVIGAFFLIRRSLFEDLGGFDERFFLYYEEVDLSLRARQLGFRSYYCAEASVYHRGRASSDQAVSDSFSHHLHSRIRYAFKHFGAAGGRLLVGLTFTVELAARLVRGARRGADPGLREVLLMYRKLLGLVRAGRLSKDRL